jgi:hypothetical protein
MQDGFTVQLSVNEKGETTKSVSVQLSPAEFAVVTEMAKFMIPRCLGLDKNW